jgi:hypothetical protein
MRFGKLDLNTLHEEAIVSASVANVRQYPKGPGGGLADVVGKLKRGTKVSVMSANRPGVTVNGDNNWFKIYAPGSNLIGWMHNSVLDEVGKTVDLVPVPDIQPEAIETDDWDLLDTFDPIQGYRNPLPSWMLYAALTGIVIWMIRK